MAYVSDSNLTQFWGLAKDYIKAENSRYANWQKTEKAGAVTCWPVGGTELLPSVDFLFSETGPASGDKGPENPSTITGVSEVKVTRCGKNLAPERIDSFTQWGVTVTPLPDGGYRVTGTTDGANNAHCILGEVLYKAGYTYTASLSSATPNANVFFVGYDSAVAFNFTVGNSLTITNSGPDRLLSVRLSIVKNAGTVDLVVYPQLELGSTATAFEPYEGAGYTLPLGSTYYGGSIDLATGVMTVTHSCEQLTSIRSLQSVNTNTVYFRLNTTASFVPKNPSVDLTTISNRFTNSSATGDFEYFRVVGPFGGSSKLVEISINKTRLDVSMATDPSSPTEAEWKTAFASWLESNPTFFVGKLATPFAVSISPSQIYSLSHVDPYTPRLNTLYTDAQAVQVGYAKSPIRSEYELTQAIIATEGGE